MGKMRKKYKSKSKNDFTLDGTTGKRIKYGQGNETIAEKNLREYLEFQERMKNHNPLPLRETPSQRIKATENKNSNFINVKENYFNRGYKKGCEIASAPVGYLLWVYNNVDLNKAELNLLKKVLKAKGWDEDI